ncbi:hypothetical protein B0H16DRAFT_1460341 [Mycena metata]|uniref:Uncharacterized protein n=1 Tax=Mycena metata TaxID=1033252 RepID=A0AAD7IVL8_9AGAR|nr:hypothetical protein B0H16DRAFT_1460341 [Mycena metata]
MECVGAERTQGAPRLASCTPLARAEDDISQSFRVRPRGCTYVFPNLRLRRGVEQRRDALKFKPFSPVLCPKGPECTYGGFCFIVSKLGCIVVLELNVDAASLCIDWYYCKLNWRACIEGEKKSANIRPIRGPIFVQYSSNRARFGRILVRSYLINIRPISGQYTPYWPHIGRADFASNSGIISMATLAWLKREGKSARLLARRHDGSSSCG